MMNPILRGLFALVLFLGAALSACQAGEESGEPVAVLIDDATGLLDPAAAMTDPGYWVTGWVYDPLFILGPDLEPLPALATEAIPGEDGLTWDIQLREGVRWQDGQDFTSQDVVFSYRYLKETGRLQGLSNLADIQAGGQNVVTIRLREPEPFFRSEVLATAYILPEHIWKDNPPDVDGQDLARQVGTGPYRLTAAQPGQGYTFTANEDYFRAIATPPLIRLQVVEDHAEQVERLRSGNAQAILNPLEPERAADLQNQSEITLASGANFFSYALYANASRPPFNRVDVRQAITQAIDAQSLADTILSGYGTPLPLNFYHPVLPWSIAIAQAYDPKAAETLLELSGLVDEDGDGVREWQGQPVEFELLCNAGDPVEVQASGMIAGWLAETGLRTETNCLDAESQGARLGFQTGAAPDYDLSLWSWPAEAQLQRSLFSSLVVQGEGELDNLTGMQDQELGQLLSEYLSEPVVMARDELGVRVQNRFVDIQPFIPLMAPDGVYAYRPAAYDGWVVSNGFGIGTLWSFIPPP